MLYWMARFKRLGIRMIQPVLILVITYLRRAHNIDILDGKHARHVYTVGVRMHSRTQPKYHTVCHKKYLGHYQLAGLAI